MLRGNKSKLSKESLDYNAKMLMKVYRKRLIVVLIILFVFYTIGNYEKEKAKKELVEIESMAIETEKITAEFTISETIIETESIIEESETYTENVVEETIQEVETEQQYRLSGDMLDLYIDNDESLAIVKMQIEPKLRSKSTISQNYTNICDLVYKHDFDRFDRIEYWAVMNVIDSSGNDATIKVISFSLDRDIIEKISKKTIYSGNLEKYLQDLYIHEVIR